MAYDINRAAGRDPPNPEVELQTLRYSRPWVSLNRAYIVGMAGLSCGKQLHKAGVPFTILEASDGVGGRVRSDLVDGFILDRGFQIFLTSYPTAKELLDYDALDLKPFYAGGFHSHANSLRLLSRRL